MAQGLDAADCRLEHPQHVPQAALDVLAGGQFLAVAFQRRDVAAKRRCGHGDGVAETGLRHHCWHPGVALVAVATQLHQHAVLNGLPAGVDVDDVRVAPKVVGHGFTPLASRPVWGCSMALSALGARREEHDCQPLVVHPKMAGLSWPFARRRPVRKSVNRQRGYEDNLVNGAGSGNCAGLVGSPPGAITH